MKHGHHRRTEERLDPGERRARRLAGLLLFLTALVLRLLFWQATPDAAWPHSAHFKGDAPTWVAYAGALRAGTDFELGLPLRPPAAGYVLAAVWDGHGDLWPAQALWCLLGALTVVLVYAAALRTFGFVAALLTGLLCALSHGLMVLSTSLNNETLYLFLVAGTLYLWPGLARGDRLSAGTCAAAGDETRWGAWWVWGALNALACLVRVEHLAVFLLTTAWLVATRSRGARRGCAVHVSIAFALVLFPWQLTAWAAIHRFNNQPSTENSATAAAQAGLEQALAHVRWTQAAVAERERMPAFARRAAANFVAATVVYRAGPNPSTPPVVDVDDLAALDAAFGRRPEALSALAFVALYGGLNFYLAHNPWAEPGFSRQVLDRPPPLDGQFPPLLIEGLPPRSLAFAYPPHLQAINHGFAMGFDYIVAEPAVTARRLAQRALLYWDGAALGFGGADLPFGNGGIRRRADLAVPAGGSIVRGWQLGWLILVLVGLWLALRRPAATTIGPSTAGAWRSVVGPLVPWLALAATKLAVSLAFFGYARHGVGAYPVFALLAALAVTGPLRRLGVDIRAASTRHRLLVGAAAVSILFVALEIWRFAAPPSLLLDGRKVEAAASWPVDVHQDRRLEIAE